MNNNSRIDFSFILNEIAAQLDMSDTLHEDAVKRYQAVGAWLGEGNSPLATASPVIYPQGSFLLGTVTRPFADPDDYDIDLVFEVNLSKQEYSQKALKGLVGNRLKANETYRRMLTPEGKRCWTLDYASESQFHLDVLPAVPNAEYTNTLKGLGVKSNWADTAIAFTDITRPNFDRIDPDWPRCNPKAYGAWFRSRMEIQLQAMKKQFAEMYKADIQLVPDYKVKTPLQRSVQLLKRHRAIMFQDRSDRPASIVITTLAAQAYNNGSDLSEALRIIVDGMPRYVTLRDGKAWIPNPVDPSENFADRWQERVGREQDFRDWHTKMQRDLSDLLMTDDLQTACELMVSMFGERVAVTAVNRYKDRTQSQLHNVNTVFPIIKPNKPWGV